MATSFCSILFFRGPEVADEEKSENMYDKQFQTAGVWGSACETKKSSL
jgi:hypothetical protein